MPERGASVDQTAQNIAVVQAALQTVFTEHRLDQIDHYFAPEFVQHSPYAAPGGREELKQWWAAVVAAIPDVTTTVEQVVADDERVATFRVVRGAVRGTLPGLGISGSGQDVEFRVADIFAVQAGKIVAHWEVADTGPFARLATAESGQ
jgi:predicted SnoaL-like aldol condensation-catalyzing enzyme